MNKSGKVLVSRQFGKMTRKQIEGRLAKFYRLVPKGEKHAFVDTSEGRYVFQPIGDLYFVLVTGKHSNILEDVETLRFLLKLIPDHSTLDEEVVLRDAFEIVFALDEAISMGHMEEVSVTQVQQYCLMDNNAKLLEKVASGGKSNELDNIINCKSYKIGKSKVEKNSVVRGVCMSSQSMGSGSIESFSKIYTGLESFSSKSKGRPAASATTSPLLTDNVTFTVDEKLNVTLKRGGGVSSFDVQGTLYLWILKEEDAHMRVKVNSGNNSVIKFMTNPKIDKDIYIKEKILGLKDPDRSFPTRKAGEGVALLKWRMQTVDESQIPLQITCVPEIYENQIRVTLNYQASNFELRNVAISVPLPALPAPPHVTQIAEKWMFSVRDSVFEWSILLLKSNSSGSLAFVVPPAYPSPFFPISVHFSSRSTFSDLKVVNILLPKGGSPPKFSQERRLLIEHYEVT